MSTAIDDKVKTPFSRSDRNQLMAWSKLAKEKGLMMGSRERCSTKVGIIIISLSLD